MRKLLSIVALVAALLLGTVVSHAGPSAATTQPGVNATPYNNGPHPWTTDGCSIVPDSGVHVKKIYQWTRFGGLYVSTSASWNFNHACVHHDGCYRGHWASRASCDQWFLNDMRATCSAMHPSSAARRAVCNAKATQYYVGVRALGGPAYNGWTHYIPVYF
jgi:Prokaryotic phospholipase A2